ncbi:ShlB/FhaC/HecB family hemolysin secretion/activation protein [Bradyrhizobium sp.]|jgi:hemolysin activation/secretion protein|uniref:ShlB/FhaC/HecB family hemolysin secretion/activation protein n=2 Tax=Nitrobacteraceae TaxID=41294 RepID=A0ABS5G826_9BRAD|nr:POTRA domain-containing protein [Bradyrhizobium sp.]MBR1137305.1 ShlB/FhaC/HecB family hemolysin secretion/activation protein [Bradyrhizobium denitrificans]NPU20838.1 ShlB/FhaC/HecB family hemolysin secretion/activation protein [Bradyrhizobium sp. LMG 8443]MDU3092405.1 POTRA domain-containing protein [Bradyrhizobium sp.]MDU6185475.1 POTRA domain-containing protein [Bradyrhizobium sp.]MDU6458252.1 POTRA domain-containing protein [Bradyrhizobium sp.]
MGRRCVESVGKYAGRRDGAAGPRASRMLRGTAAAAGMAFSALLGAAPGHAQQVNQPSFDPRQTEKYFDEQSRPAQQLPPRPRAPTFGSQDKGGDRKTLFTLRGVALTGASALPADQLAAAYQSYIGKPVSQADLAAIATAISDLYRAAGFHLSRAIIPPQDVSNGTVRVQIIEGSITEVSLQGPGAEEFGIRAMLGPVLAEQPSRLATLERQLLLINSRGGVRLVDSSLEEIGGTTGRFRLILELKTWHVYGFAGIDNMGSSTVGPWQSYATAAFNSYLLPGDTLTANLSTTPGDPRQLAFGRLSYDVPLGTDGVHIGASALYSEVRPGDIRRRFNDNTVTETIELRGGIAPIQSQRASLNLTMAAAFSDVTERDIFGIWYRDRIRTLTFTSDYRWKDDLGGDSYLTLAYRQGLNAFGATPAGDIMASRAGASPSFSVVNGWFTRYQALSEAWSLKLAAAGQLASGPLYNSQQFYLGGLSYGRGYGSAEISGDNGIAGTFEVRFEQTPNWAYLKSYQLYSFFDAGLAWNDGFRPSDGVALTSAGAGVRFTFPNDWRADLGVAVPLGYRAPDNSTRGVRLLLSLSSVLKLCPQRGQGACM